MINWVLVLGFIIERNRKKKLKVLSFTSHSRKRDKKKTTYLSPQIQNEIVGITQQEK